MSMKWTALICLLVTCISGSVAQAGEETEGSQWTVRAGTTSLVFNHEVLAEHGLSIGNSAIQDNAAVRVLTIDADSTMTFEVVNGSVSEILGGKILNRQGLTIVGNGRAYPLSAVAIGPIGDGATWLVQSSSNANSLILSRVKHGFDAAAQTLTIRADELRISPALAAMMGTPDLAGLLIGSATIDTAVEWVGGAQPEGDEQGPPEDGGLVTEVGPDMTFCQLYGLYMPTGAREGDVVGLSLATTSWNVGTADIMWFNIPDEEHPFIVMNLYRLNNDRFEQIGQSHIKHGFYALGSHQCGGPPCTFEPGHGPGDWLGTGCTDTYSASLNAVQSGMGPRYEVNPWTGYWYYPGSHMDGPSTHDHVTHRLQVHDADLDPAQNEGATYYGEGFYVLLDDVDAMNSAAWKSATVSGSPGGQWSFGMSGASTYPNIGYAIDAWAGATQTLIAQQLPIKEFQSPDGRCVLAAKATQLTENTWHYEYALLNIDMDRQVGSFSVPIVPGTIVTNQGFHAVEHHDEPFNTADPDAVAIDNAPWVIEVGVDSVSCSTATNPLRWGTLYNYRFDANAAPQSATVTLGLFRPGTPETVSGETIGPGEPMFTCTGDLDGNGSVDVVDLLGLIAAWGDCPGCPGDLDGDNQIGVNDLLILLAAWGPCL